nr:hypothetical protein GCM10020093_096180 [Planobispora longispora]
MDRLAELRRARGRLVTLRELRYADLGRIDRIDAELESELTGTARRAVAFLQGEDAFAGYHAEIERLVAEAGAITATAGAARSASGWPGSPRAWKS